MLPPDEGYVQPALVCFGRAISITGFAESRNPFASTPAQCSATKISQDSVFLGICLGKAKGGARPDQLIAFAGRLHEALPIADRNLSSSGLDQIFSF